MQELSSAGLTFNIRDPFLISLELSAEIFISSTFNQSLLEETIEDVILSYLSPKQFPFTENRIRYTKLISLISSIPGVVNVESLNLTGVGQDEDGFNNWLPKLDNDILFSKKGSLPLIAAEDLTITYTVVTE